MHKVTFVPRHIAAGLRPATRAVLISIHDRSEPALDVRPGWLDVLYLRFHDTDGQTMGLEVFSAEQARSCLEFVDRHRECDELIVHCQLGQSRSASVALFFAEQLAIPCYKQTAPVNAMTYRLYNRKVYATLHEAAFGPRGQAFAQLGTTDSEG